MISDHSKQKPLSSHVDAVIHFLQKMEIDMLNNTWVSNKTYQDFKKTIFYSQA
jgi:hypothetical protein